MTETPTKTKHQVLRVKIRHLLILCTLIHELFFFYNFHATKIDHKKKTVKFSHLIILCTLIHEKIRVS
jgi:hypothetical protein